jgi:hypothetical protein
MPAWSTALMKSAALPSMTGISGPSSLDHGVVDAGRERRHQMLDRRDFGPSTATVVQRSVADVAKSAGIYNRCHRRRRWCEGTIPLSASAG